MIARETFLSEISRKASILRVKLLFSIYPNVTTYFLA
jgi:hypothetical protein